ncbi:MAG: BON domain-containing protein [Planctomycetaceae bacterium]
MSSLRIDPGHGLGELIQGVLASHPDFHSAELICEVVGDELVITGRVRSYYQKQIAQETLRPLAGRRRIRNDLRVLR